MIRGATIRAARKARGWTQRQLADAAGLSQPYVSLLERSEVLPESAIEVISHALELQSPDERTVPEEPALHIALLGPTLPRAIGLPLRVRSWQRPERGGDGTMVIGIGEFAVMIAAIDVVGHGESTYPLTTYLLGWLRGRVASCGAVPRLEQLAAELYQEMNATGAEAGFCLALVQHGATVHEVRYEALVDRYPHPLLLIGAPPRTMPSVAATQHAGMRPAFFPHVIGLLRAPWRLVVASDGLLARLGGGDEAAGSRALRRWQSGVRRDTSPDTYLDEDHPPVDDESLLLVAWESWDEEVTLTAGDKAAEERVLRRLLAVATGGVGQQRAVALVQSVLEALDNVDTHAYERQGGPVRVRWRAEPERCTVEVADAGRGISASQAARTSSGLSVMQHLCAFCEARVNDDGGTTVMLVVEHEDGSR